MAELQYYLDITNFRSPSWLDEETVIYISDETGVNQLWKKKRDQEPVALTDSDNFIADYRVDYFNQLIYFTTSEDGDEKFQIYQLKEGQTTKVSQGNDMINYLGAVRNQGQQFLYTSNQRDFAHFDLMAYDLNQARESILVYNYDNYNFPMTLSPDGKYFIYQKLFSEDNQPLWLYDFAVKRSHPIFTEAAAYDKPVWKKDASGFYYLTNAGSDFIYVAEYDLTSKQFKKTLEFNWDIENIALNHDGSLLAVIINEAGQSTLRLFKTESIEEIIIENQPTGVMAYYDRLSWAPHSNRLLFNFC